MRDRIMLAAGCMLTVYFILSVVFFWGYNLALLALGLVMIAFSIQDIRTGAMRVYRNQGKTVRIIFLSGLVLVMVSVIIVEGLIIGYAVRPGQMERSDYLMILGASIRGEELSRSLQGRLDKGLEYLWKYPGTRVIVSGGQGMGESITEAEAMKRYLVAHGIAPDTIIKEDKSTSTYENFLFTRQLITKESWCGNTSYTVVTNGFHMFRSRLLAKRQGLVVRTLPCRTEWYLAPNCYAREYFAVIKSFIFDR